MSIHLQDRLEENNINSLSEAERVILLSWCRSHDWGLDAVIGDDMIYGLEDVTSCGNNVVIVEASFDSVEDLISWAGY